MAMVLLGVPVTTFAVEEPPTINGITLKDEKGTDIEAASRIYRAVEVGDKLNFSAAVDSGGAPNKGVTRSVGDEDIATIDAATGELTVQAIGGVGVTATSNDDESVYAEFYLQLREPVQVSGVKIFDQLGKDVTGGSTALAVSRGVLAGLSAVVSSGDAENLGVDWSSSDESIVVFDEWGDLVVTGYGTVTVTATSLDDPSKSATVTVRVSPPSTAVTGRGEPHSVALLTLTATGDEDDELTADMTWKTFIPGTTVDLELKFVMPDGSVAGQVNLMDWVATYGDMAHTDPGFVPLVPTRWGVAVWGPIRSRNWLVLSGTDSDSGTAVALSMPGDLSGAVELRSSFSLLASSVDFVLPLSVSAAYSVPGLARLAPGGAVAFDYKTWFAGAHDNPVWSVSSSDASVAVWEDGYIKGLSEGTATLTFKKNGSVCGSVEVAVGDWVPPYEVPAGLTAVAGTRLGDVALPAPTDAGAWAWVHPDDLLTTPGPTTHKALYTPTDPDSNSYCPVLVDVPVEVYLETTVTVKGKTQRLRVYNPNNVLPDGTLFEALAVTEHEHIDDDHEIEHLLAYDLSLLDASGNPLHMPLDATVELCFEVLDGLDKDELEVVLVKEFEDAEFEEELVTIDGSSWVKVKTDHFSPYVLIDRLSAEEKAALDRGNIQTGDLATQITVAGLGMTLVLALGIMLRLITNKRKFEE